ncbi:MAG: glycine oxidase ThiO [Acidobacteria bacterium]|nr:MAG: glycine oxidase ThiO [Acidobacteriota bacterium]PYQ25257.1 MAG: glycine oxidase ThiO [Acidobacteriota bacterium]
MAAPAALDGDVIVVGGGIVGLSAARALAAAGARTVVVERQRVGAEASTAAAGMLAPQAEAEEGSPLLELALRARDHHSALAPALEAETGLTVDLAGRGLIELAFTAEDRRRLAARREWQVRRGLAVEALGPAEVREAEPNVNPEVCGGLYVPGDRCVDNVRLVRALAASAVARGASIVTGRPVTGLVVENGRVAGVTAAAEVLRAPVVINAMGAWAGLLAGDPLPPPVEPVRGHIVAFDMAPALLRHVVCSPRGYLVPRADGRTLAGSTTERAGFDKTVTAAGLRAVLAIALEIAPVLADVRVADSWAGLRPGTPDGLPVIGPGALPGLIHATGLYRNGILLGPLAGEIAAALARGLPPPVDLAPFAVTRFAAARR